MKARIGIRPIIDGRWGGVREALEEQTMKMAKNAKKLIEENIRYADGTPAEVVISPCTIGGGKEAAVCEDFFATQNVVATLSVTPCWCYGSETMDLNPLTIKAVWGLNATERPGAVYLAAVMAVHNQRNLPAFAIYGKDVQEANDYKIPEDVKEKILRFSRCALAVGQMRNKAYVALGSVCMGIGGSFLDPQFMQDYFGIRAEWVDMIEIIRRVEKDIYDKDEFEKALSWAKKYCKIDRDRNLKEWESTLEVADTKEEQQKKFEFTVKMTLIIRDIMLGNDKLNDIGWHEEALGRNAIAGGFQGQRQWTDFMPNADFSESILNTTFDWNGNREPFILATENDVLNGMSMLLMKLITGRAAVFSDVRTYWSPAALERVSGYKPTGKAKNGFMHLINSGASALDGNGCAKDSLGNPVMKSWWDVTEKDQKEMLTNTLWAPSNKGYFRGGGFSSKFSTDVEMPVTMIRINMIGNMPTLQIAEGWTVNIPKEVTLQLWERTDPTWPCTWFAPRINENDNAFKSVYDVMANWGANHGAWTYGHLGKDLITLASMLRIPVSMHNVEDKDIYRPHAWSGFGTKDLEGADFRACNQYGPIYGKR